MFRGHAERAACTTSSMDVYRACGVLHGTEPGPLEPLPLTEDSSAERRRLQTYPPAQIAYAPAVFGWLDDEYDKIPVERVVLGDADLPGTVLRLPMVYRPFDPLRPLPSGSSNASWMAGAWVCSSPSGWRTGARTKGYVEDVARAIALLGNTVE